MNEMIKIDDLVYQYRREDQLEPLYAVNHVSIDVERGSFTVIIGKNGSGKSTLAKNINALLLPSGGAIYVKGYNTADETKLWEIRQAAGMVFQNPDNQLVSTIVEDDVAFGPENLGIEPGEIRQRVDDSLYAVNMYEERKKAPHLLSGGQKQRIAIAGVIAMRPECIILDEPTAMLDPHGRAEVMEIIEKLNREGITILLITHFMDEAARADRVIIMEQGRVTLDGTPEEVYGHAEEIKQLGLDVPFAVDVAHRLRKRGIEIPGSIIRSEEFADYIAERAIKPLSIVKEVRQPNNANTAARTDENPVIEVKNLTHIYSEGMPYESAAIKDISFRIERGSFVGIIGHTGSGKSTLIQHLNGLLKAKSGSIVINDIDITAKDISMREIRRKIGLVFQYPEYQLFEETVHKDVAFGPLNLGLTQEEADNRVVEAIKLVGLNYEEIAQRSPFELSGGQKRRVAIAGVIAMKPQILILDEPTAGLDPKAHADILKMIETIHIAENISILLVSHNMGDVARLADKVLVLDRGQLAMMGTPTEVFSNADRLETLGLGLPPAAELMKALRYRGIEVPHDILKIDSAEEELHLLIQNRK
ncbi:MAG: cobalt transport protein ATP-binding subunit [Bacillota bacterium]|nr:cobalt transport protein ATP-binding subunit [Bacillota bacterium]